MLQNSLTARVRQQLGPGLRARDVEVEPQPHQRAEQQAVADRPPLELHPVEGRPARLDLLVKDIGGGLDKTSSELASVRQKRGSEDWDGSNLLVHVSLGPF